ncbi:ABC transporter substrate-binding protein [Microlunatus sp. Gsoil 973]|uniref:ABC transporter substrate-binding protein n=1 Tax=Microlunatus sp. Gsoil 973 TaxID=2672569 RepID=UPI0012B482DB|nr:ABC transporter substrate-binding protein [Microlunatus sp. Gsoil 973]QGN34267.1 ABC transporter substrate-binding protein [Microlunatus sp. Gsoil 973]
MTSARPIWVAASAGLLAATLALTGCSEKGSASASTNSGTPTRGGSLQILATADVDHIDPTQGGSIAGNNVQHAITRSLLGYKSAMDIASRNKLQPDLATQVPTPTDSGRTYIYKIREGVAWDAPGGPRQITSADFARGVGLMCNPYMASPRLGYVLDLIKGMAGFCAKFAKIDPTAPAIKKFFGSNAISGIDTSDPKTVVVHLVKPAGDFNYMMTLPATAPQPVEALAYLPDSVDYKRNFVASGPYTVGSYSPNQELTLVRNKAWKASTDPLRAAYVDKIHITQGVTPQAAMQQLQSGDADLTYDISMPAATLQQLSAAKDDHLVTFDTGATSFIWFNQLSDNNGGALKKVKVRQALEYAVDKKSLVQQLGGTVAASPQHGILGPGINGYHDFSPYPSPNDAGDPAKAKQLLAEAGYPNGLTLKLPYSTAEPNPSLVQILQASFAKAGVTVKLIPENPVDLINIITDKKRAAAGDWDLGMLGWQADWVGGAARAVFGTLYTYQGTPQTYNLANYDNPAADRLAEKALATTDAAESGKLWEQVDEKVMADPPIIPTYARKSVLYYSERVQNYQIYPIGSQADWTNVWLKS